MRLSNAFAFTILLLILFSCTNFKEEKNDLTLDPLFLKGKQIVLEGGGGDIPACISCHGENAAGVSGKNGFPRIANQQYDYILKQLQDFKSAKRVDVDEVMAVSTKNLSQEDMRAAAFYLSHMPEQKINVKESSAIEFKAELVEQGRLISEFGIWDKGIPACIKCHGPSGEGIAPFFPRLAGQHYDYSQKQLEAFKSGKRNNDVDALMGSIALRISDDEIKAVLAYYEQKNVKEVEVISNDDIRRVPALSEIPQGPFGDMVIQGLRVFTETGKYASEYVGKENKVSCVNCHLHGGLKADSAPMWGAYGLYPQYRSKNKKVDTFANRIQGCFIYSMDGVGPDADSEVIRSLSAYAYWVARGKPLGEVVAGSLYPVLDKPQLGQSPERGKVVYESSCLHCHGGDGEGRASSSGVQVFPPLWGPHSYNWGAGMHRINTAAGFIQANMPFGHGGKLSLQDAWDVASYVNSHERPEDPRNKGTRDVTRETFHKHQCAY